jgi:UDP-N-acetylmuramoyl-tripeptide--D-alanyl-D-alanine ligase
MVIAANKDPNAQIFDIADRQYGSYEAFIPTLGRHTVQDALLAYTAATRLGLNAGQCAAALAAYVPAGNRQQLETLGGVTLLEDFYNAGPASMAAALSTLAELETPGRRVAVLGDMLELGSVSDEEHEKLGVLVQKAGIELLVTVGPKAALAAGEAERRGVTVLRLGNNSDAAAALLREAKSGDAVLIKASRGMRFEEILEGFKAGRAAGETCLEG